MTTIWTIKKGLKIPEGSKLIDITASGNKDHKTIGALLAPPMELVTDYKKGSISKLTYRDIYNTRLRAMYSTNKNEFKKLFETMLRTNNVIFPCFCNAHEFCHRFLATKFILTYNEFNFVYGGELDGKTIVPYYVGSGPEGTPKDVLNLCSKIASKMEKHNFCLRTLGNTSIDKAFSHPVKNKTIVDSSYVTEAGFNIAAGVCTTAAKREAIIKTDKQTYINYSLMAVLYYGYAFLQAPSYIITWLPDGCTNHQDVTEASREFKSLICLASLESHIRCGITPKVINLANHNTREVWENWVA